MRGDPRSGAQVRARQVVGARDAGRRLLNRRTAVALSLLPGRARLQVVDRLRHLEQTGAGSVPRQPMEALEVLVEALFPEAADARLWASDLGRRAGEAIASATRAGLSVVPWSHEDYPRPLDEIANPPVALWVRGNPRVLRAEPRVGVVGSRAGSTSALHIAREIGRGLATAGVVVVSGLARGVDGAAHEGALTAGQTVAVVGCGADVDYPFEHRGLAARVAATGAIVSELPPGTAPHRFHFPLRNRLISGLCRGVVVVEASERSGSLITAGWALDQGRDVMVVPGCVTSGRNRGGHALVRDGARLVESAEHVLEDLGLAAPRSASPAGGEARSDPVALAMRPGEALDLDDLQARTGWEVERLLDRLLEAELAGQVRKVDGGRFVRIGRK